MALKTIKIDGKWSIQYDPLNNDRPVYLWRYDKLADQCDTWNNWQVAMFYSLLEAKTC